MMTHEHFVQFLLGMIWLVDQIVLTWRMVCSGRLRENEAHEVAYDLAYGLAKEPINYEFNFE